MCIIFGDILYIDLHCLIPLDTWFVALQVAWLKKCILICHICHFVVMDILLLGCCTRFLYTLIKRSSQLAKIIVSPIHILSPLTGWTNWPINDVHISNLNWRQIFPLSIYPLIFYIHFVYVMVIAINILQFWLFIIKSVVFMTTGVGWGGICPKKER